MNIITQAVLSQDAYNDFLDFCEYKGWDTHEVECILCFALVKGDIKIVWDKDNVGDVHVVAKEKL